MGQEGFLVTHPTKRSKRASASGPLTTLSVLSARVLKSCGTPDLAISSKNSGGHLARRTRSLMSERSAAKSVRIASLSASERELRWDRVVEQECPLAMDLVSVLSLSLSGSKVLLLLLLFSAMADLRETEAEVEA